MSLDIHQNIVHKLNTFKNTNRIPNIIFHGPSGGGKHTLVNTFINDIYNNDKQIIKNYVMNANCAHGKGIKFVREDLKFFAKTNINTNVSGHFKTIIMTNADKLTIDAQSALRRCIELFNHTTRFFIIVEDRNRLLKPIISRFCEIYVPLPTIGNNKINLHTYTLNNFLNTKAYNNNRMRMLKRSIETLDNVNFDNLKDFANSLYQKGYSGLDLMNYIESSQQIDDKKKYTLLLLFEKAKIEFRCEKFFIYFILYFTLLRSDVDLENIQLM